MAKNLVLEKSFLLAVSIVRFCRELSESKKEFELSRQLLRSGTSVGANVQEAQDCQTARDFVYKLSISQKECGETLFWLRLLKETKLISLDEYNKLYKQAEEVKRLLGRIIIAKKKNMGIDVEFRMSNWGPNGLCPECQFAVSIVT